MSSAPLGFGIIGAGMIAGYHAAALAHARGAKLIGVADPVPGRAAAFAGQHGAPFATTKVEELVARPDIHVICVTTPSGAHLEPALIAARAGKHIIVEKPIEITVPRVDQLLDAATAAGVRVMPIFQARFGEGARRLKAALDEGRFGRLVLCSAYVKWHRAASYYTGWKGTLALDGGGAVMNQSIHAVDLLQWFAGMPVEVFARTTRRVHQGIEAEDTACATLRFASGALGVIEASTAAWPGWSRRLEICGEHGSVSLEDDHLARWDFAAARPEDDVIRTGKRDDALGSGASAATAITYEGHLRQIQDMIDAVQAGRPPVIEGRDARNAVALITALYASAKSGSPVQPA